MCDPIALDPFLIHHITKIGENLMMNDLCIVALNGFGPIANTFRFKPAKELLSFSAEELAPHPSQFSKI